jgi:hypothetical protein
MTVKTQNLGDGLRVITKSGRVSCSCCEGCCMYPASALIDQLYTDEDLPDEIKFVVSGGGFETLAKIPPTPVIGADEPLTAYYGLPTEGVGILETSKLWATFIVDLSVNTDTRQCLFDTQSFESPNLWYVDNFADTYTVVHNTGSGTVSRTSLCVWEGEDNNGCPMIMQYEGTPLNLEPTPSSYKWIVGISFFDGIQCESTEGGVKTGFQNNPIGTYLDENEFFVATVS